MTMDMPEGPPGKPPGERLASYFENFFRTIVGISTLGASITFSKIVQAPVTPFHDFGFSTNEIQYLVATSWLFFILSLAFTSFFASALSLWRPQAVKAFGTSNTAERRKVLWFATAVSALLFGLAVISFVTISLVVVAYTGAVGWVAVVFTVIFALLGFGTIIWRSPMEWPQRMMGHRKQHDAIEKHIQSDGSRAREYPDDEDLTDVPRLRPSRQQPVQQQSRRKGPEAGDYGRSTSGDYQGGNSRYSGRGAGYDVNRYSRASTVISDAYEPGRYGQGGVVYDDGVREGMVMTRYD